MNDILTHILVTKTSPAYVVTFIGYSTGSGFMLTVQTLMVSHRGAHDDLPIRTDALASIRSEPEEFVMTLPISDKAAQLEVLGEITVVLPLTRPEWFTPYSNGPRNQLFG